MQMSKTLPVMMTTLSLHIAAANASMLEEVVVTAQKRGVAESIQDIPSSLQAIGSEMIDKNQLKNFAEYAQLVPSLLANDSGGGQTQISMRGVFAARVSHAQPQTRSTAAMYVNDIPVTTAAFNPDAGLFDIERVEVLRGPQGTLYGSGSMSGAIRLIPKSPDLENLSGSIGTTLSFAEDGDESYEVNGVLNIPVGDTFALRGVGYYGDKGGYIDNVFTGEDDYNDEEMYGGRLTGRWVPSDSFSLEGMLIYHNSEADGRPEEYVPGDPEAFTGRVSGASLVAAGESLSQHTITDDYQITKPNGTDPFDDEFYIFGLTAEWQASWATIVSVTSYFDREYLNVLDDNQRIRDILGATSFVTGEPFFSTLFNESEQEQFTQELRFVSTEDAPFRWLFGLFYSNEEKQFDQQQPTPGLDLFLPAIGLPDSAGFGAGADMVFEGAQSVDTEEMAAFGEMTFAFGSRDQFEFTVGARAFEYEQDTKQSFVGVAIGTFGGESFKGDISESGISPKFLFNYRVTDDNIVYASAAEGFRLGGTNTAIPVAGAGNPSLTDCGPSLAAVGIPFPLPDVDSDSLWQYEIGSKNTLWGGKARANIAAYYIDWDDVQTQVFLPCGFIVEVNSGKLVSTGLEMDFAADLTDQLSVNFGAAYTSSELDEDSVFLQASKGDGAPFVPEWHITGGFDYRKPVDFLGGNEWYLRGNVVYVSERDSQFSKTGFTEPGGPTIPNFKLPSYTTANLYTGLVNDNWEFAFFVKNLTDERIVSGIDFDRRQPATFTVGRPRTVGFNVKYSFE